MKQVVNQGTEKQLDASSLSSSSYNYHRLDVKTVGNRQYELSKGNSSLNMFNLQISDIDTGNNITQQIPYYDIPGTNKTQSNFIIGKIDTQNNKMRIVGNYRINGTGLVAKTIELDLTNINSISDTQGTETTIDSTGQNFGIYITQRTSDESDFAVTFRGQVGGDNKIYGRTFNVDYSTNTITTYSGGMLGVENSTKYGFKIKWSFQDLAIIYEGENGMRIISGRFTSNTLTDTRDELLQDTNLVNKTTFRNKMDFNFLDPDDTVYPKILLFLEDRVTIINIDSTSYQEGTPMQKPNGGNYGGNNTYLINPTNGLIAHSSNSTGYNWLYFLEINGYDIIISAKELLSSKSRGYYYTKSLFSKIDDNRISLTSRYDAGHLHQIILEISEGQYYTSEITDTSDIKTLSVASTQLKIIKIDNAPSGTSIIYQYQLNEDGNWIDFTTFGSYFNIASFTKIQFRIKRTATATATPYVDDFKIYTKE